MYLMGDNQEQREFVKKLSKETGYRIIGLPVAGFDRAHVLNNISVLYKLAKSQMKARHIIKDFKISSP